MKTKGLADAIQVYRHAIDASPDDDSLQSKAQDAETNRQAAVAECLNGQADAALQACQIAQPRGASDEFSVQVRKAMLLQSMDRPGQALDAYIAANVLKPADPAVARAIVALTESTGRDDALTLSARGDALVTLGRGTEALAALKQAQRLTPTLPNVKLHLAAAEKLARAEARKKEREAAAERLVSELANASPPPPAVAQPAAASIQTGNPPADRTERATAPSA